MLYTKKGDSGTTKTFGCDQRISKSSLVAEALGTLDETNSFLGLVKSHLIKGGNIISVGDQNISDVVHNVQENLFIIQAELAGAGGKTINQEKVQEVEGLVNNIEKKLPPIKSFFIPGATQIGALFDVARTISRRAERRVVATQEEGISKVGECSMAYLNRLSSLLYALARLANFVSKVKEDAPNYK